MKGQTMRIETERLYIRQLIDKDFDLMSLVWTESWPPLIKRSKSFQDNLLKQFWESAQDPTILTGLIFLRDGDVFCGHVNMQHTDQKMPEVGIDLLRGCQNQGYGPEAIAEFVNWYGANRHISAIKVRISALNTHSAHVFAKLGAKLVCETSMFPDLMQRIREDLPEGKESTIEDIKVGEYTLELPVYLSK